MNYAIPKDLWHECQICGEKIENLAKTHGGGGIYYSQVFHKHITIDHNMNLEDYFIDICKISRPECWCHGWCNKKLRISYHTKIQWRKNACGKSDGVVKWAVNAQTARKGEGNPMYHKKPWNKGLTKETSSSVRQNSEKNMGKVMSDESKQKMSISAKKRKIHGHTGHKHSEASKQLMRDSTLKRIKEGKFKQTKTKPHLAFAAILDSLNILYEEEKTVSCWSFDFYVPDYTLYIEVDGDYFHSNPKIYPNGPKTKTQKRNYYRDTQKNKYCVDNQIELLRFWECDILNTPDDIKAQVKCKLKEL